MKLVAVGDVMVDIVCAETLPVGARVHAEVSVRLASGDDLAGALQRACEAGARASSPSED